MVQAEYTPRISVDHRRRCARRALRGRFLRRRRML